MQRLSSFDSNPTVSLLRQFLLVCVFALFALRGVAQTTPEQYTPVPNFPNFALNGPVFAMQEVGDLIYVGGNFTQMTTRFTENGFLMTDINRGGVLSGFPNISGSVQHMISDGRGGWYLFGRIRLQEGTGLSQSYWGLRVTHTLSIDPSFRLQDQSGGYGQVYSAVEHGSDIYVAASSSNQYIVNIFRIPKNNPIPQILLAGIENKYFPFVNNPVSFNQYISAMSINFFGKNLILAGDFNFLNGTRREKIIAFDLATSSVSSDYTFDFDDRTTFQVNDMLVIDDKLWLGGLISYQNTASPIAYLDLQGNLTLPSSPMSGYVYDLERYGNFVFAAGVYYSSSSDPTQNDGLRVINVLTEQVVPWGSPIRHTADYNYVRNVKIVGNTVFLAGNFNRYGATTRNGFVALNAWDGQISTAPNYPQPSGQVYSVGVSGNRVLLSGFFTGFNPVDRPYLLAFSKTTGAPINWNSRADGPVYDFAYDGSNLIVGGDFTSIAGASRSRVAVLNASNRALRSTTINADARVNQVATNGTLIAIAGDFTQVNGNPRSGLALVNRASGILSSWSPTVSGYSYSQYSYPEYERFSGLAFGANDLYLTGYFSSMNGQARSGFAAFELSSLSLSDQSPRVMSNYNYCNDVVVDQGTVYVAGYLNGYYIGTDYTPRSLLVAFDDANKTVSPMQLPQLSFRQFYASNMRIAITSDRIYLHGGFEASSYSPNWTRHFGFLQINKADWSIIPTYLSFTDWPILETFPKTRYRYAGLVALIPSSNGRFYVGGTTNLNPSRIYGGPLGAYELITPPPTPLAEERGTLSAEKKAEAGAPVVEAKLSLAPNPTVGPATLTITLPEAATVSAEIMTVTGQSFGLFAEQQYPKGTHSIPVNVQPGAAQVVVKVNGRPFIERILRF